LIEAGVLRSMAGRYVAADARPAADHPLISSWIFSRMKSRLNIDVISD
jgi:hypothetical protein